MDDKKDFNQLDNLTPFSKDNQPTPEQKSLGWAKKRTLKELLSLCISGNDEISIEVREKLAEMLGLKPDDIKGMTFEEAMDLKQAQRAMVSGRDWKHLKDVVYGQKIENTIISDPVIIDKVNDDPNIIPNKETERS